MSLPKRVLPRWARRAVLRWAPSRVAWWFAKREMDLVERAFVEILGGEKMPSSDNGEYLRTEEDVAGLTLGPGECVKVEFKAKLIKGPDHMR